MSMSNKTYDVLKWITQILLPAVGALYFALSGVWNLPYPEEVLGTISAVTAFLGILLGISTSNYNNSDASTDGTLVIDHSDPNKDVYKFEVDDLKNLDTKKRVNLKVHNNK